MPPRRLGDSLSNPQSSTALGAQRSIPFHHSLHASPSTSHPSSRHVHKLSLSLHTDFLIPHEDLPLTIESIPRRSSLEPVYHQYSPVVAMRQTASEGGGDHGGRGAPSVHRATGLAKLSLVTLTVQTSASILTMHHSRTMPLAGTHRYFPSTAVLLHEVIKLAVSLTLALYEASKTLAPSTPATVLFEQIFNAIFSADGWKLVLPAALCTLHNTLQYVAVGNLDAVQFQVLYQLKILTAAVSGVFLLSRPLAPRRWLSLVLLAIGISVASLPSPNADPGLFHGMPARFFPQYPRSKHELGHGAPLEVMPHLSRRSASYQGIDRDTSVPDPLETNYALGVTAVLVAAAVSGLTGVYFERVLKESPSQASVWIRNLQLGLYSLLTALGGGVIWHDGAGILEHGFFEGYNAVVWATVVLQAAGGIMASLVVRDADMTKNFAPATSIVLSFVLSIYVFGFQPTKTFLVGTSLVLLATYLYNAHEDSAIMSRKPVFLRIASFEKPAIESLLTPTGTPKHNDLKRLNTDPFNAKGLGMSTSRPNSPMVARSGTRLGKEI